MRRWAIRIKRGQRKRAVLELGIVIKPRHIYVSFDKFCDAYNTRKYAELFSTQQEARKSIEYDFEEAVEI